MRTSIIFLLLAIITIPLSREALAQGPCTGPYRDFDFWIGEWDVLNRNRPDGESRWYDTGMATDRVYPIAAGCGIVEHWRGSAFGEDMEGFSVRAFNPNTGQWELVLLWPTDGLPRFGVLRGGFRHNRGEFFSRNVSTEGDTTYTRFTFSDITPETVRWQDGTSSDDGRTWSSSWIMEFTRRELLYQGPLLNGPSVTTLRCPAREHRAMDFLIGEWRGRSPETASEEDAELVKAGVHPVLDGCGIMERVQAMGQNSAWEVFRVRTYEPEREKWVEYRLDTRVPWLQRLEADPPEAGQPWVFMSPGTERADQDLRVTLTRDSDGPIRWSEERWNAEAGQWQLRPGLVYEMRVGASSPGS
ncbi:MAG: hypothetical protein ACQET1_10735 [Gemmatimonadota bacterium]